MEFVATPRFLMPLAVLFDANVTLLGQVGQHFRQFLGPLAFQARALFRGAGPLATREALIGAAPTAFGAGFGVPSRDFGRFSGGCACGFALFFEPGFSPLATLRSLGGEFDTLNWPTSML
jgi:hypothetical protein